MFTGSIVALVTPFHNGAIDFMALEKLIKWHLEKGTDGILVVGSTGEGMLLSDKERESVINASNEILQKRIPLIVGASFASTKEAVDAAKMAEKNSADAVLSIVPFYVKPTQKGIIQHFSQIHEETQIPIILYNNPGRCSVNASVETIIELAKKTRIIGLKDSNADLSRVVQIKSQIKNFKLLSGDDASLIGYLAAGGDGAISVTANVAPELISELIKNVKAGDLKRAGELNEPLVQLSEVLFLESNPIPVKYALYIKGFLDNELRSPLTPAADTTKNVIESITGKWNFN